MKELDIEGTPVIEHEIVKTDMYRVYVWVWGDTYNIWNLYVEIKEDHKAFTNQPQEKFDILGEITYQDFDKNTKFITFGNDYNHPHNKHLFKITRNEVPEEIMTTAKQVIEILEK